MTFKEVVGRSLHPAQESLHLAYFALVTIETDYVYGKVAGALFIVTTFLFLREIKGGHK